MNPASILMIDNFHGAYTSRIHFVNPWILFLKSLVDFYCEKKNSHCEVENVDYKNARNIRLPLYRRCCNHLTL